MQSSRGVVQPIDPAPVTTDGQLAAGLPTSGQPTVTALAGLGTGTATLDAPFSDHAGFVLLNPAGAPAAGQYAQVLFSKPLATWAVPLLIDESSTHPGGGSENTSGAPWSCQLVFQGTQIIGFNIINQTALPAGNHYRVAFVMVGIGS